MHCRHRGCSRANTTIPQGDIVHNALLARWTQFSTITTFLHSEHGGHCVAYSDVWKGGNWQDEMASVGFLVFKVRES